MSQILHLESILTSLKQDFSDEKFLIMITKIEILSLYAESITAEQMLSFVKLLPNDKYHFNFIKNNMVFYILNYSTLGNEKQIFVAETLYSELQNFHIAFPSNSNLQTLNNAEVLYQFKKVLESIKLLKAEIVSPIGRLLRQHAIDSSRPTEKTVKYSIIQKTLTKLSNFMQESSSIKNCRIVAELIDVLYNKMYKWFMQIFTYEDILFPNDNFLDRLLKMDFCYTYYASSNQHLLTHFENAIDNQIFSDPSPYFELNPVDSPELQYMNTFSLKIFSKNLSAKNEGLYIYPLLKSNFSILTYLNTENILFHHGLIFHILHQTSLNEDETAKLVKINGFFNSVIQQVLLRKQYTPVTFPELLDKIYHLHRIGLNIETCQTYIQIITTCRPIYSIQNLQLFFSNLSTIVFSAYIFFICIEIFSPTFIFHNKKKIIIERQKSIILILGEHFSDIWKTVMEILEILFTNNITESYFKFYTKGADDKEKTFLYKDLMEKWGDLFFPLTYSISVKHTLNYKHVSNNILRNLCRDTYLNNSINAYKELLPFTGHPSFENLFVKHYIVPSLTYVTNLTFEQISEEPKLLQLIYACKLLLPSQYLLSHYLMLLHAFTLKIFKIDLGLFSILRSITQKIFESISTIIQFIFVPQTNLLVSVLLTAYTAHMKSYIDPWIQKTINDDLSILKEYINFTKQCSSLIATTCYLNLENFSIIMYIGKAKLLSTSFNLFSQTCSSMIDKHKNFQNKLKKIENSKLILIEMLQNIVTNITNFKDLLSNSALQDFLIIVEKIYSNVNTTYQDVLKSVQKCNHSNSQIMHSLEKVMFIINVLSSENIENNSLTTQLLEARRLIRSEETYTQLILQDDLVAILKPYINGVFEKQKSTTNIERRFMTEARAEIKQVPFLNIFDERYRLIVRIENYLHWYIAYNERVHTDLIRPLLFFPK
ncbi:tegument protein UL37 [macacine betaherpesvirus 9]|uniref:Tegument protein UL37 n=1 Tax=macacine betaherpesvirus 9 TaxID=2560568 RepID=A0A192XNL1_9BETA|nr:tegument protein UL37 [macacine betaherpesvirus 9]ANC96522.1 tegument protein UL37 [macacine betaherpesvirus 9]